MSDLYPNYPVYQPIRTIWTSGPTPQQPMGCICPPTSEQTCMNPLCPRKPIGKANDVS
jgi:hypothetical protein